MSSDERPQEGNNETNNESNRSKENNSIDEMERNNETWNDEEKKIVGINTSSSSSSSSSSIEVARTVTSVKVIVNKNNHNDGNQKIGNRNDVHRIITRSMGSGRGRHKKNKEHSFTWQRRQNKNIRRSKRISKNYKNLASIQHVVINNDYNRKEEKQRKGKDDSGGFKKRMRSRNDSKIESKMKKTKTNDEFYKNGNKKRVIVIGAGIAGLAAARELIQREYNVVVVEARHRPGGRLKTVPLQILSPSMTHHHHQHHHQNNDYNHKCQRYSLQRTPPPHSTHDNSTNGTNGSSRKMTCCPTDMGGAFVHGVHKNPIFQMLNQMGITTRAMNTGNTHTLLLQYDNAGWPVRAEIDAKVQNRFNDILERALFYVQLVLHPNNTTNHYHDSQLPLAHKILRLTPNTDFGTLFFYLASLGDLKKIQPNVQIVRNTNDELLNPQKIKQQQQGNQYYYHDKDKPFLYSSNKIEQSLFQWHLANLELSCGTSLEQLGLQWNEDEQFGYNGHHVILREGFGALIEGLILLSPFNTNKNTNKNKKIKTIPIQYGVEVSQIKFLQSNMNNNHTNNNCQDHSPMRVQVVTTKGLVLQAHHVICTLPLGILAIPPNQAGHIHFDPPLPPRKQLAISRLGFGHYNKCALSFPYTFWINNNDDFIGVIDSPVAGKNILVMNISVLHHHNQVPVLIFVFGGTYAHQIETLTDSTIVHECMDVLQRVLHTKNYAKNNTNHHIRHNKNTSNSDDIPQPIDYVVTRWGNDRYSRGAFSYIPPGVDGFEELTVMSEPIYAFPENTQYNTNSKDSNSSMTHNTSNSNHDVNGAINPNDSVVHTRSRTKQIIKKEEEQRDLRLEQKKQQEILLQQQKLPLIMFAGEATTPFHPSTIHGAYLSGIREAYRLDLILEPKLNNYVQFEKTSLYRRTFSVKRCLPIPPPGSYANFLQQQSKQQSYYSSTKTKVMNSPIYVKTRKSNRKLRPNTNTTSHDDALTPFGDHSNNHAMEEKSNERSHIAKQQQQEQHQNSIAPLRKSKRFISTNKRIFYGDLEDRSSSDSENTENYTSFQNIEPVNDFNSIENNEDENVEFQNCHGFSNTDDLALLRGVDTFGSDWEGMKNIKSKLFPTYQPEQSSKDECSTGNDFTKNVKTKTIKSLRERYNDLVVKMKADCNVSISNGNDVHISGEDGMLKYEETKKHWMLSDGSGCWITRIERQTYTSKPLKKENGIKMHDEPPTRKSGRKRTPKLMFDI